MNIKSVKYKLYSVYLILRLFLLLFLQIEYFLEFDRHVVWLLSTSIILLKIEQEAKKHCVNCHGVHGEEAFGDEVGSDHDEDNGNKVIVQLRTLHVERIVIQTSGKYVEGKNSDSADNDEFAEEKKEVGDLVEDGNTGDVPQNETKSFFGRDAEVGSIDGGDYVGVAVDELHELFETPEAAFTNAEDSFDYWIVCSFLFQLILDVLEDETDELDDGDDERTEGESPQMVAEGSAEAGDESHRGKIFRFI